MWVPRLLAPSTPQAERAAGTRGDWRCTKYTAELQAAI